MKLMYHLKHAYHTFSDSDMKQTWNEFDDQIPFYMNKPKTTTNNKQNCVQTNGMNEINVQDAIIIIIVAVCCNISSFEML